MNPLTCYILHSTHFCRSIHKVYIVHFSFWRTKDLRAHTYTHGRMYTLERTVGCFPVRYFQSASIIQWCVTQTEKFILQQITLNALIHLSTWVDSTNSFHVCFEMDFQVVFIIRIKVWLHKWRKTIEVILSFSSSSSMNWAIAELFTFKYFREKEKEWRKTTKTNIKLNACLMRSFTMHLRRNFFSFLSFSILDTLLKYFMRYQQQIFHWSWLKYTSDLHFMQLN